MVFWLDKEEPKDIFADLGADTSVVITKKPSSGDGQVRSNDECEFLAATENCTVRYAKPNELFLDIDTAAAYDHFLTKWDLFERYYPESTYTASPSKSGLPKQHIVVTLKAELPLITRIALQACLGSDSVRELISLQRAARDEPNVVIFFEKRVETT